MAESHCPICYTALETRDVAPCYDCGHDPVELGHFAAGKHTYDEVALLGARAVLCDSCQVDFGSYDPTYFGRPPGQHLGRDIHLIRRLDAPSALRDKFCPACQHRLAFVQFVQSARSANAV